MMKIAINLLGLIFTITFIQAQSAPISIDGRFDDWAAQSSFVDETESINGVDLLEFEVSNDEDFLFVKVIFNTELNLKENDPVAHNIFLDLDTDNDPTTGYSLQTGYGSELSMDFSHRRIFFNVGDITESQFGAVQARFGPTVTSTEFEIAISRHAFPDGVHPLFTSPTIRILWRNMNNDDTMPNTGEVFFYTFDDTPVPELIPTNINKENPNFIRIVAYNTLFDGLEDASQSVHLGNMIKALQPDIIGFSECNNTNASTVLSLMNSWLPIGGGQSWHILKNGDLITASRWPYLNNWPDLYRQFPALIDLPDTIYTTDLLFTNAHLRCCGNNEGRQEQADEYASFILDIKSGDIEEVTQNTPFVYAGDLNLVGYSQQLTTLVNGDIQDTQTYGTGGLLDWDDTELTDQICRQTDKRMAYTWRNDFSSFPPGRLDFVIFSDAVMTAEKSFSVQTAIMSPERLDLYNLNANDAGEASDHFPVIVDFSVEEVVAVSAPTINIHSIFPNPATDKLTISFAENDVYQIRLTDALGRIVLTKTANTHIVTLDLQGLDAGLYYLDITASNGGVFGGKVVVD